MIISRAWISGMADGQFDESQKSFGVSARFHCESFKIVNVLFPFKLAADMSNEDIEEEKRWRTDLRKKRANKKPILEQLEDDHVFNDSSVVQF